MVMIILRNCGWYNHPANYIITSLICHNSISFLYLDRDHKLMSLDIIGYYCSYDDYTNYDDDDALSLFLLFGEKHGKLYDIHSYMESADPGLCQGRGGAWDHRRCGTWLSGRKQRHTPSRQHLCQLHAPAICFSEGLRLPFARPQSPQTLPTLPQASKATTLTATTCPCHLFFRGFKTAVCPPSNPPNASNPLAGLQGNNSYSYMPLPSVFQGVQDCRLPALKPPKRFRRPPRQQLLYSYMPLPSVFQGVQDCRLPALKPPKRFRRPPRQQLLQLHAPAICFSGGSRLPFARPQTPQTLPQASKATTLTATCLCHLFFRGFKTAVCPPSNPPNASNPPAGLQGNNSDS